MIFSSFYKRLLIVLFFFITLFFASHCTKNKSQSYYYIATGYFRLIKERKIPRNQKNIQKVISRYKEKVIFYSKKALKEDPNNWTIHIFLSQFFQNEKNDKKAIYHYEKAIELNPDNPNLHNNLAMFYATTKNKKYRNPKKALKHAKRALDKDPNNWKIHYFLGTFFLQEKQYKKALFHFEKGLEINPDSPNLHNNLAMFYATTKNIKYRNPKRSLKHAKKAVKLTQGKKAYILDTLAEAYFSNHNYQKAVNTQKKALSRDSSKKVYWDNLKRFQIYLKQSKTR